MSVVGRLCMEAGRILKLSVLSTQFCCESTTALKYGLALKKKNKWKATTRNIPWSHFSQVVCIISTKGKVYVAN